MKISSLRYLTKEGVKNIWKNRLMSLASITVLMACLVIIGLGAMLYLNIDALLDKIESQNVVMAYIEDGVEPSIVGNKIKTTDNIEECIFVPKEDAFRENLESMGSDAVLLEGMENPLPDAYKIVVADLTRFDETVSKLRTIEGIETVRENSDVADKLINIRYAVTIIAVGIVVLLFFVALFIISNTIRITMFSRKLEISIMKAVGATNWFVRWPFMIEGMLLGVISSIVSFGLLLALYQGMLKVFTDILQLFTPVSIGEYVLPILALFLFIGVFTGTFGSLISMRKYLKEQGSVISEDK